jgi:hypothetical protein
LTPGPKFLHQHVGLPDQLFQNLFAFGRLGVESERLFVAIQLGEVERIDIGNVTQLAARNITSVDPLDFQYVRAKPRKLLVHAGPACTCVKSIILIPSRGKLMSKVSLFSCGFPRNESRRHPTCTPPTKASAMPNSLESMCPIMGA